MFTLAFREFFSTVILKKNFSHIMTSKNKYIPHPWNTHFVIIFSPLDNFSNTADHVRIY